MQRIGPTAGRLAVYTLRLLLVAATLRHRQLIRVGVRPSTRFERVPIAGRGDALQAEVDPDRLFRRDRGFGPYPHRDAQVPLSKGILGKAPIPEVMIGQIFPIKDPEGLPAESQRTAFAL